MSVLVLLINLTCAQVNEKGVTIRGLGSLRGEDASDLKTSVETTSLQS